MNHSLKAGMKFAPANFVASIPVNVLSCCHCKVAVSYYYQNLATSMQNLFSFTINFDGLAIIIIIIEHTTTGASLQR